MTLIWKGDAVQKDILTACVEGAFDTAEAILTLAIDKCPRDTAVLRNSGTISVDKDVNGQEYYAKAKTGKVDSADESDLKPTTKAIYVSFNTPYAYPQHEELNYNHPKEGEAKYLEKAWNAKIKQYEKNVKREAQSRGLI